MRENMGLYRGKRKDNGEWVEGAYSPYNWTFFGEREEKPQIIIISDDENIDGLWCEVIPETVGEFTGLTDKNVVKAFEGDIIKTHYANAQNSVFIEQIVFHNGKYCAYSNIQDCKQWANLYDGVNHLPQDKSVYMDCFEIIGNIHDNPELLEKAENP